MISSNDAHVSDMTTGKPFRLLLRFALPLFLGNLLQQIYNLADTAIAGHILGDAALAEIGATAALYSLIISLAFGLNNGLALIVSRSFGAGDQRRLRQSVGWMLILSAACAVFLTISFLSLRVPLLRALQTPASTAPGALRYLTVILAGIPLTMAYNLEASLLQAVGNSRTPLLFLLLSSVLNVPLDLLFMGPLDMGVGGAAIATVLSQGVCALLGAAYIRARYPELRFTQRDLSVSHAFVADMFSAGVSMALMSTIYSIGSVMLQSSINALGNVYITAQVAGRRLAELIHIPGLALGTAMATYASQNYGANRRARIAQGIRTAMLLYILWWFAALAFTFMLGRVAVQLITDTENATVLSAATQYLYISIPMIPPMAAVVIFRSALQGMNHRFSPLVCSSLELIEKIVFALWIVPAYGYTAVCICEPVAWVICCIFIAVVLYRCRSELQDAPCAA